MCVSICTKRVYAHKFVLSSQMCVARESSRECTYMRIGACMGEHVRV